MVKNNTVGKEKIADLFDAGTFVELGSLVKRKGESDDFEGVICGYGAVDGRLVYAFVQDGDRRKGAFDELHAKKIERLYELAIKGGAPVIGVFDSAGAVVYDGAAVLSGYGRLMRCVSEASGVIPQIAIVDGICGGCSAALCAMFDIVINVDSSKLFVSPDFVLGAESKAPEFCAKNVATAKEAFKFAAELLSVLPSNNSEGTVADISEDDLNRKVSLDGKTVKGIVCEAADRESFVELYDRYGDEMTVGFASFGGVVCGIVASCGRLGIAEARKACKMISFCDSFHIPVVTFVDSDGLKICTETENANFASELARLAYAYTSADTAKLTVVAGKAYGASFTLLGSKSLGADMVLALEDAKVSVLPPEASVAFLWNDKIGAGKSREDLEAEWKEKCASAYFAAEQGEVDDIIESAELRQRICAAISMLASKAEGIVSRKHINMPL